mgnify:CR=1 FL=1
MYNWGVEIVLPMDLDTKASRLTFARMKEARYSCGGFMFQTMIAQDLFPEDLLKILKYVVLTPHMMAMSFLFFTKGVENPIPKYLFLRGDGAYATMVQYKDWFREIYNAES